MRDPACALAQAGSLVLNMHRGAEVQSLLKTKAFGTMYSFYEYAP